MSAARNAAPARRAPPADPRRPTVARRRRSAPAFLVGAEQRRFAPALDTGDSLRIPTGANMRMTLDAPAAVASTGPPLSSGGEGTQSRWHAGVDLLQRVRR